MPPMLRVYENQKYKPSPPPFSEAGYFKTILFGHLIIHLFYICLFALKILGLEKITGHQTYVPHEF